MRTTLMTLFVLVALTPARATTKDVDGEWILSADFYGNTARERLQLQADGDQLSGTLSGEKVDGTRNGNSLHFVLGENMATRSPSTTPPSAAAR
jgi:hypothetical protein